MKQNVRFQVGICPENSQLDEIQNGRPSVTINFNIPDRYIDHWTITIEQYVRFHVGYMP